MESKLKEEKDLETTDSEPIDVLAVLHKEGFPAKPEGDVWIYDENGKLITRAAYGSTFETLAEAHHATHFLFNGKICNRLEVAPPGNYVMVPDVFQRIENFCSDLLQRIHKR
jgi:hypothetical protein